MLGEICNRLPFFIQLDKKAPAYYNMDNRSMKLPAGLKARLIGAAFCAFADRIKNKVTIGSIGRN